jgi:hypothetical protein
MSRIERESITLPLHDGCRINREALAYGVAARPPLPNVVHARPDAKAQAAGR